VIVDLHTHTRFGSNCSYLDPGELVWRAKEVGIDGVCITEHELCREAEALKGRELEQAVIATFLHSQPMGQKALTQEVLVLLGATKPDRIELEKGLRRWTQVSWFLDEAAIAEAGNGGVEMRELPKTSRLGTKPNLTQMHSQAVTRVLHARGIVRSTGRVLAGIQGNTVSLLNPISMETETRESVDTLVYASANTACDELYKALKDKVKEVHVIGDALGSPPRL